MRTEFVKAYNFGTLVKSNSFDTPKGKYRVDIREWNRDLYFFKYRDGELLECMNLCKTGIREVTE